ncbi:unnamed protein product, partial [Meganyctiphanes norvegica]
RYTSLVFGSVASPFLLAAVLEKHILDNCANNMVKRALLNNTYVDNIAFSNNFETNMCIFLTESTKVMESGSFQLRQWSSNCNKLMKLAKERGINDENTIVKVLGITWDTFTDRISFGTNIKWEGKFCKRSVLAASNSLFDPLGYICPISMQNKLFLQKLWMLGLEWETEFNLDHTLTTEWRNLLADCNIAV